MSIIDKINKYHQDAHKRAQRRKSSWNLLLIPVMVLPTAVIWFVCLYGVGALHMHFYPGQNFYNQPEGIGPILASLASLFAAFPLGMIIGNWIVYKMHFVRRVLDKEAQSAPDVSYGKAQVQLLKLSGILVPVCLVIALGGTLMSW